MRKKHAIITLDRFEVKYNAAEDKEKNVIGRQIAYARQNNGLNLVQLSDRLAKCGLSIRSGGINKWEQGDSVPNAYQLLAVCKAMGIRDALSYFTGDGMDDLNEEGLRKLDEYRCDLIASGRYAPALANIEYIDMPVSNLSVSAGTGEFLDEGGFEMISFPADSIPANAKFGVRVAGDSMEPVFNDGQIVWVQECSELRQGEVGIFVYDGCGFLKVYGEQEPEDIEAFTDSNGAVRKQPVLISYNRKYEPRPVSPELTFEIVGRVVK